MICALPFAFWHDFRSTSTSWPERARHTQLPQLNHRCGVEQTQEVRPFPVQIENLRSCIADLVILAFMGSYARLTLIDTSLRRWDHFGASLLYPRCSRCSTLTRANHEHRMPEHNVCRFPPALRHVCCALLPNQTSSSMHSQYVPLEAFCGSLGL